MRSASDIRRRPGVLRDPIHPSKTLTLDSGKWRNLHSRIIAFCANAADASTNITPRRVPHECHHTVGRAIQETESSTERSGLDIFYSTCACRARPGKLDKGQISPNYLCRYHSSTGSRKKIVEKGLLMGRAATARSRQIRRTPAAPSLAPVAEKHLLRYHTSENRYPAADNSRLTRDAAKAYR